MRISKRENNILVVRGLPIEKGDSISVEKGHRRLNIKKVRLKSKRLAPQTVFSSLLYTFVSFLVPYFRNSRIPVLHFLFSLTSCLKWSARTVTNSLSALNLIRRCLCQIFWSVKFFSVFSDFFSKHRDVKHFVLQNSSNPCKIVRTILPCKLLRKREDFMSNLSQKR